jgi:hypothetical protein
LDGAAGEENPDEEDEEHGMEFGHGATFAVYERRRGRRGKVSGRRSIGIEFLDRPLAASPLSVF